MYLDDWHVEVQSEKTPQKGPMEACLQRAWAGECGIWEAKNSRSVTSRQPDLHSKFLDSLGCIVRPFCLFVVGLVLKEEGGGGRGKVKMCLLPQSLPDSLIGGKVPVFPTDSCAPALPFAKVLNSLFNCLEQKEGEIMESNKQCA